MSLKNKLAQATSKLDRPREAQEDHPANFGSYEDGQYIIVETDIIKPNPDQPRQSFDQVKLEELANSIKEKGLLQPLVVRVDENRNFFLIAGERRLRACKIAGLSTVPTIIKSGDPAELALIENIQREDLNPIDEAEALNRLVIDHDYTHEQLASVVSKGRSTLTETLSLTKLPEEIKEECRRADNYPRRLLVEIAKQNTPDQMLSLFARVKEGNLKSAQVREITRAAREKQRTPAAIALDKTQTLTKHLSKLELTTIQDAEKNQLFFELQALKNTIDKLLQ